MSEPFDHPQGRVTGSGDPVSAWAEEALSPLHWLTSTLTLVRDDFGFDTATLFARSESEDSWHMVERVGPNRPWHPVLDPEFMEVLEQEATFPDVRSLPGVGERLAALGCGSLAVYEVGAAGRLILDGKQTRSEHEQLELDAKTRSLLVDLMEPTGSRSAPADAATPVLVRLAESIRYVVDVPGYTPEDLLASARDILRADDLALIRERPGHDPEVLRPSGERLPEVPSTVEAILRILPSGSPTPETLPERLVAALGMGSARSTVTCYPHDDRREVLVVTWAEQPAVNDGALAVAVRILANGLLGFEARDRIIETHLAPERTRWAHDVHDGVTQTVTGAVIQLQNLRGLIERDPRAASELLERSEDEIRRSLAELRGIMADLYDGAPRTRHHGLASWIEDVVARWRLPARVVVEGDDGNLPQEVRALALIVIREALTNAAKHAAATHVAVRAVVGADGLTISVRDNGRGFDPRAIRPGPRGARLGMQLIRDRVAELGGRIEIATAPGAGTEIVAFLPASEWSSNDGTLTDPGE